MVKLIALDLDGTLLGGTQPHYGIMPEAIEAMKTAAARGVMIGIASGRELDFMEGLFPDHQIDPVREGFPSILMPDERYVYTLREGAYRPDVAWNTRVDANERSSLPASRALVGTLWERLLEIDPKVRIVPEEAIQRRGFIELRFASIEAARQADNLIDQACRTTAPSLRPIRNGGLIALRHRDVGKGNVLLHCARSLGLRPQEILAVGDNRNDRSMLDGRYGFLAGTVANAEPEIKELVRSQGGHVAERKYGAGVAELIYQALDG